MFLSFSVLLHKDRPYTHPKTFEKKTEVHLYDVELNVPKEFRPNKLVSLNVSIQDHLAHSLDRKDQESNRALAERIVNEGGATQLQELVGFFLTQPPRDLQKDCVLTMAWVGELSPKMLVPYIAFLLKNFDSDIPRVVWGSMIALAFSAHLVPNQIYNALPKIIDAMDAGTPVTRDHGYRILLTLYQTKKYQEDVFCIILEQIQLAPSNQFGQYAEKLIKVLDSKHKKELIAVLEDRGAELTNEHHKKRLDTNLKKCYK